jgi:hypothetical protein
MTPVPHIKPGPGRPRKYGRAARAVTVTLPEDVLHRLAGVHTDLGRAIVALAERNGHERARPPRPAEIATYGKQGIILVTPAKSLKRLSGVQLVPLDNGRALISLDHEYSIAQLELDIRDALESRTVASTERAVLQTIGGILRQARRSRDFTANPRTIIVIERRRARRSS